MRRLHFKYAKAQNFLCFGPAGVEINFASYGNIVSIRAQNWDVNDKSSSNGAGKSSLAEIPVYALYGKTIKKPTKLNHSDVINFQHGKKLYVEFQWDDYRVVRTREPNSLRLWKSEEGKWDKTTELTRGGKVNGKPATQAEIEDKLKLTYETFVNLYIFSDDPTMSFLESDAGTKRSIVENLLSLEKYRNYFDLANTAHKELKETVVLLGKEYSTLDEQLKEAKERLLKVEHQTNQWRQSRQEELAKLNEAVLNKLKQLETTNVGAALVRYQEAQQQIQDLKNAIPKLEAKRTQLSEIIAVGQPKYQELEAKLSDLDSTRKHAKESLNECVSLIERNSKVLKDIANKIFGEKCPYCMGAVTESNFSKVSDKAKETLVKEQERQAFLEQTWRDADEAYQKQAVLVTKVGQGLDNARKALQGVNNEFNTVQSAITDLLRIKEPNVGIEERLVQEQVESLKSQALAKKMEMEGATPFEQIKLQAQTDVATKESNISLKRAEITTAETNLPYYDFWVKAFGDRGIRKYIIDGIIPALNNRIAYWLQYLIDNRIKLAFDSELQETIDRYPFMGRPYVYWGMSGGQRQRLNLAVSQAFSYIMMLNCGTSPSVVFLDEVSKNIDESGVDGIYRMICELAKERQVFVIDHNPHLLALLDGCDTIQLEMRNEIATITR